MKNAKCLVQQHVISAFTQLPHSSNHIYIGYSGGVDSHVLLHACAMLPDIKPKIIAVYIHHGLQTQADSWAEHCQKITEDLRLKFVMCAVNAAPSLGESPEEAARNARYAAFKQLINENDVILLAQHQEDQLETVLLQLFRGSGLRGLAGMPEKIEFSAGLMLRPLLQVSKQAINAYALKHNLTWIEDPSNQDIVYDRNFLRKDIIPALKTRWPSLDKTVSRSAAHCAQSEEFISSMAKANFQCVLNKTDNSIDIKLLQQYPLKEQHWILREWFELLGMKMPSLNILERIICEMIGAKETSSPQIKLKYVTLRRYHGKLMAIHKEFHVFKPCEWPHNNQILILSNNTILTLTPQTKGISKTHWENARITLKTRQGGEKIRLPNRQGHHDLKKLFQDATIPPWQREVMPLIYLNDKLAAVGNLWIAAEFYTEIDLAYGISLD